MPLQVVFAEFLCDATVIEQRPRENVPTELPRVLQSAIGEKRIPAGKQSVARGNSRATHAQSPAVQRKLSQFL